MNPFVVALVAGATVASVAALAQALVVPILVAVIMGGPAWLTARQARKEGLTVASILADRLDRIETKIDDFTAWRVAHDVRLGLREEGASGEHDEAFIESLLEVLRQEPETDEDG